MSLWDEINRLVNETVPKSCYETEVAGHANTVVRSGRKGAYLKKANPKLQVTAETLFGECNFLQKTNGELRQQRLELNKLWHSTGS